MSGLSELAPEARPRERLLRDGAHTLEPAALLALVLGTGRGSGEDALQLAGRVLATLGGLEGLAAADEAALQTVYGIGPVRAARIRAAFELALRAGPIEPMMSSPEDPMAEHLARLRGQLAPGATILLGYRPGGTPVALTQGVGLDVTLRVGSVLAQLLQEGAGPWWIVAHRPGGAPSEVEVTVATRLIEAARLVGLSVTHVVLLSGQAHWMLES